MHNINDRFSFIRRDCHCIAFTNYILFDRLKNRFLNFLYTILSPVFYARLIKHVETWEFVRSVYLGNPPRSIVWNDESIMVINHCKCIFMNLLAYHYMIIILPIKKGSLRNMIKIQAIQEDFGIWFCIRHKMKVAWNMAKNCFRHFFNENYKKSDDPPTFFCIIELKMSLRKVSRN
jgi:hypothetical protein